MKYVKFGNAGIQVSRLCLGAMEFPDNCEEKVAQALLDEAIDAGINFIDTADAYGRGTSEEFLGRALTPEKRDKLIIATKFWVKMYRDNINGGGCSRYHIIRAVEASLRRLKMDYIDLIQLHHPDPLTPVEETLSTLDNLVKQGKVRYIGVCNHYAWQMAHMLGVSALHNWEPLVSIQCRYSLLDRVVENETIPFAKRFNIATMTYGPLAGGVLTGKYKRGEPFPPDSRVGRTKQMQERMTDEVWDILDEVRALADKYGVAMNKIALAWLVSKPYVTCPILGGKKPEHFNTLYDVCEFELAPEDLQHLDKITASMKYGPFANQSIFQGSELALNRW